MVYGKASSGGSKETDNTKPSVLLAKYKLLAEEELKKVSGYGPTRKKRAKSIRGLDSRPRLILDFAILG